MTRTVCPSERAGFDAAFGCAGAPGREEMVQLLKVTLQPLLLQLAAAAAAGRTGEISAAAHAIKGTANVAYLRTLSGVALDLEGACRRADVTAAKRLAAEVASVAERSLQVIEGS